MGYILYSFPLLFFAPILVIVLFFYIRSVSKRVKRLEEELASRPQTVRNLQAQEAQPQLERVSDQGEQPAFVAQPETVIEDFGPSMGDRFIEWAKQDFLVKVGALLLLIAFGWFVSYAFANNWIGEMGRIVLGLLAGIAILIVGERRIRNYLHQGGIFLVLGSTIILLTIWAAREIYDFFTPSVALIAMFLSVAFVGLQSYLHNSKNLAVASLVLASLAPLFTNSPNPEFSGLFTYLLLIVLSTIWIVFVRGWNILAPISLLIVGLYSLPFMADLFRYSPETNANIAVGFAFLFTAIFYVSNIASVLYTKSGSTSKAHLITGFGTGLFLTGWVYSGVADNWMSLTLAGWALVFGVGAYILYQYSERLEPFYIYGGVGVALVGIATAMELEGALLTMTFTLEAALLVLVSIFVLLRPHVIQSLCYTLLIPGFLTLYHFESYVGGNVVFGLDFFAMLTYIVALLTLAYLFRINATADNEETFKGLYITLNVIASFLSLALVWVVLHEALSSYDVATTISLILYTITGISAYLYGRFYESNVVRIVGAIIIGFVIGRLLLVEVWNMALAGRIITFFLIGILLTSTAFMRKFSNN